jgi:hypothetical protein
MSAAASMAAVVIGDSKADQADALRTLMTNTYINNNSSLPNNGNNSNTNNTNGNSNGGAVTATLAPRPLAPLSLPTSAIHSMITPLGPSSPPTSNSSSSSLSSNMILSHSAPSTPTSELRPSVRLVSYSVPASPVPDAKDKKSSSATGAGKHPGDWICNKCAYHNYVSR